MFKVGDVVEVSAGAEGFMGVGEVFELDLGCKSGLQYHVKADGRLMWCEERELALKASAPAATTPPQDPKAAFGATKANLALNPGTAACEQALAQEDGAIKYGPFNWRYNPVEAMTYLAAAKRHIEAFIDGQDRTGDTDVHNLGAVMACCAIVIDAQHCGTLVDNRPRNGHAAAAQDASKAWKAANWPDRRIDWTKGAK